MVRKGCGSREDTRRAGSIARKEEARLKCTQRYEWRTKEKKEVEEDTLEDLVVESTSKYTKSVEVVQSSTKKPGKVKPTKTRNP